MLPHYTLGLLKLFQALNEAVPSLFLDFQYI